jgi:hypothetical protein
MKTIVHLLCALSLAACTHQVSADVDVTKHNVAGGGGAWPDRSDVARETCEAQYEADRQNYLSAIETILARSSIYDVSHAPLENFRAEINGAYNAVVSRCKTHMHCLEVKNYDEAGCYMAATDRKDAERRFEDLSIRLRELDNQNRKQLAFAKKKGPSVNVQTSVNQSNTQTVEQEQTTDIHNGDVIEDQDVLQLCGSTDGLLDRRCRCSKAKC